MRTLRSLFVAGFFILCVSSVASRSYAQVLPLSASSAPAGIADGSHSGLYTAVPVELDGVPLFQVAARTNLRAGEINAFNRALLVDNDLQELVAVDTRGKPVWDASTLRIRVQRTSDGVTIEATDARHQAPVSIVTVTWADAKYQQSTIDDVAASWQDTLQNALVDALRKRDPAIERAHAKEVAATATGLALGTVALILVLRSLRRRIVKLADSLSATETSVNDLTHDLESTLERSREIHQLTVLSASYGAICWLIALSWFIAVSWSLSLFSQTTALSRSISHGGMAIGIICIGAALLNRVLDVIIARAAANWKIRQFVTSEERARILLRVPTAASAVADFKTFLLIALAAFLSLGQLGLPVASAVTIGGLFAVAVGIGAQNFLKDVVGGIEVLYEDQYAIGDFININGHIGVVEQVTLRMARIRDTAGSVVTISHSSVTAVSNYSRIWSRIDYRVSIGPEADPDKALDLIRTCVEDLSKEAHFRDSVVLPLELMGVDAFTKDWTLLRARIRTAPHRQFALRREINGRVRRRFVEAGIPLGPPIDAQYIPIL